MNKADIEAIYPLAPMQQSMLLHTLAATESRLYFQQLSCSLRGELEMAAFKAAWQCVVERHDVLRTLFTGQNRNSPLQVVLTKTVLPWQELDWRALDRSQQTGRFQNFMVQDRCRGFQLDQAPLLRCTLIRVSDRGYRFVFSYHHILMDAWAFTIVLQEVFACYSAHIQGESLNLAPPPSYRDYLHWLQRQDPAQAEVYWRKTLQGVIAPTPLVVDRPGKPKTSSYKRNVIRVPDQVNREFHNFAHNHKLTLHTLFLGTWALLLHRYSQQQEVLFGTTVSGRAADLAGIERMVGLFVNTLPVRVRIDAEQPILIWLQELQAEQAEREAFAYSSLLDIQTWSELSQDQPLFESLVIFEKYPASQAVPTGLSECLSIEDVDGYQHPDYPLVLSVLPADTLSVHIHYDSGRFDADTVQRLGDHLLTLLQGMLREPQCQPPELELLTAAERRRLFSTSVTQPPANTEYYILDRYLNPVPVGVPAELYVGVAGMKQSNLKRPELTAEGLIAHPFSDDAQAWLYKTGDLARYRPDGSIECLGRTTHQEKVWEFIVEPAEVNY